MTHGINLWDYCFCFWCFSAVKVPHYLQFSCKCHDDFTIFFSAFFLSGVSNQLVRSSYYSSCQHDSSFCGKVGISTVQAHTTLWCIVVVRGELDYVYSTTLLPWLFVVNCIYCSLRVPVLDTVFLCFCSCVLVLSLILTSGHLVILSSAVVASGLTMSFHSRARYHVLASCILQ